MKRSNAIILGTVLVFLIGVLLFIQTASDPFVNKARQEFQQTAREQGNLSGTLQSSPQAGTEGKVTADDLVNQMGTAPAGSEVGSREPGTGLMGQAPSPVAPAQDPSQDPNRPSSRWFDPNKRGGNN